MKSERPTILIRLFRYLRHHYFYKPAEKRWLDYVILQTKNKEIRTYE